MLDITVNEKEKAIICNVSGELTIASVKEFKEKISGMMHSKKSVIGLDLGLVTFIDSTGIGAFVEAINASKAAKKDFILFNLNPKIEDTFSVVGLKSFFKILSGKDFSMKYL